MPRRQNEEPPKPSATTIRAATALTVTRDPDPISCCNVCHLASRNLGLWREHDEFDGPIDGHGALVFVGLDHPTCLKVMDQHPRLYARQEGLPGYLPLLCGPCAHRDGFSCRHPDLKANGGAGLSIMPSTVFACARPRSKSFSERNWVECVGREVRKPPAETP